MEYDDLGIHDGLTLGGVLGVDDGTSLGEVDGTEDGCVLAGSISGFFGRYINILILYDYSTYVHKFKDVLSLLSSELQSLLSLRHGMFLFIPPIQC